MAGPWVLFAISNSICVISHFMDGNFNKFKACFQGACPSCALSLSLKSKPKDFAAVSDNNVRYKQPTFEKHGDLSIYIRWAKKISI